MKLGKLLAVAGATMLLCAFTSAASAGRLSLSGNRSRATWTRMDVSGGFGTVECEVVMESSVHAATINKTVGSLVGYTTAANVTRCARGGMTFFRESLPWHERFSGFEGTLPNITGATNTVTGVSFQIREPTLA